MITNTNKNVICVKDIPSNIIEEAIFILKPGIDEESVDVRTDIARTEAEEFIGDYVIDIEKLHRENSKKKKKANYKFILEVVGVVLTSIALFVLLK